MRKNLIGVTWCALCVGLLAAPGPSWAQQKTAKDCNAEWTANKATIQASGKKKKDFMAECRGTAPTAAAPAPAPGGAAATAPAPAAPNATGTKTAKECDAEWTANKASIQASGKKKKDFMAECRGMAPTAAAPAPGGAPAAAPAPAAPDATGTKTAKECNAEWTANKASIQASGKKKKDFMAECRGTATSAAPTTPPAQPSPTAATPAPEPPAAAPPAARPTPSRTSTIGAPAAAGQFATEAAAKSHCPGDTVVWANLDSKIYHFSGTRDYGNTKKGAYMCEHDTASAGFRAAKNEKHP